MKIDLNTCVKGDILVSKHGMMLTYIEKLSEDDYYDHLVQYPNGSMGTRMNDGYVYKNPDKRLDADHDIVKIIKPLYDEGE